MSKYYPHHATCPFYQYAISEGQINGTDVITILRGSDNLGYMCIVLSRTLDQIGSIGRARSERDVPRKQEETTSRSQISKLDDVHCSHISLLNLLHMTAFPNAVK